ncbi:MAG: metallophosphoesterase, partial [Comamonas sp.]|nr:metallophosphoesterase [Candidatus Comamonas equi]
MSLIQPLPSGPLDIVGDIHGELSALEHLLTHLGYDAQGRHPEHRTLVFVGDFVDRGPDSPGVVDLVQRLVEGGHACAIAGSHEINLLRHDPKDGSGWFFAERLESDLG